MLEITGELSSIGMAEVLQLVTRNRVDGRLTVSSPSGDANLHIRGGRVVGADFLGLQGTHAVLRLLARGGERFHFAHEDLAVETTIAASVDELLFELARADDEIQASRTALLSIQEDSGASFAALLDPAGAEVIAVGHCDEASALPSGGRQLRGAFDESCALAAILGAERVPRMTARCAGHQLLIAAVPPNGLLSLSGPLELSRGLSETALRLALPDLARVMSLHLLHHRR